MSVSHIILRASPDWLNFDIEESRSFCRRINQRDDLIVEFAHAWGRTFGISFCEIRHEIKLITLSAIAATRDCKLGSAADLGDPADDDLFVFMDDDDWCSPHLFETIRAMARPEEGWFWGSIFLGKFLVDAPGVGDVAGVLAGSSALQRRPFQHFLYTNNYAVTGRTVKRLGVNAIFEHHDAQDALRAGRFSPASVQSYLSCANKHPWCTMAIMYNSRSSGYLQRLNETVLDYARALDRIELDADTRWIAPYLDSLKALVARILAARRTPLRAVSR